MACNDILFHVLQNQSKFVVLSEAQAFFNYEGKEIIFQSTCKDHFLQNPLAKIRLEIILSTNTRTNKHISNEAMWYINLDVRVVILILDKLKEI